MSLTCVPVKATLNARGEAGLTTSMWAHIDGCDGCRGALADDRLIRSDLEALALVTIDAPPEIVPRVLDRIGPWAVPDPEPTSTSSTVKVIAAAAVATAAATAAASTAVLLHRARHRAA